MKINIKKAEVEYESDYPEGWRYAEGDAFKFPVNIGNFRCFVRRFEKKSPEEITGWELLRSLRGKYIENLVQLYDISTAKENGKDIYYIFYEFLDGGSLDQMLLQRSDLDPRRLSDDIFRAISTLHETGFWCCDFSEEQICSNAAGKFHLVKLENTQGINVVPYFDMTGSKTYWRLVLEFYKQNLNQTAIQPSDLNGISLNYLQIPFLILRIRLFQEGKLNDYSAPDLFETLPVAMKEYAPEIGEVFTAAYRSSQQPLNQANIEKLREIIQYKIIPLKIKKTIPLITKPVIKHFTASKYKVQEKALVTFQWGVLNADKVEIYKNGTLLRQFHNLEVDTNEQQFFDQNRNENVFYLRAYSGNVVVDSESITIEKSRNGLRRFLKIIAWIVGVIIMLFGLLVLIGIIMESSAKKRAFNIHEDPIYEDSVLNIETKEPIDTKNLRVFFNARQGIIKSFSGTNLLVAVPDLQDTTSENPVIAKVSLTQDNEEVFLKTLSYVKKVTVSKIEPASTFEGDPISIQGKNLNVNGLKVYFNNEEAEIVERNNQTLRIKPPNINEAPLAETYKVFVVNDQDTLKTRSYQVHNFFEYLIDNASLADWTSGTLSGSYDLASPIALNWQGGDLDVRGFARVDQTTMEDGLSYRALRMHPKWEPQGSISGKFKPLRIPGKKKFEAQVGFKSFAGTTPANAAFIDGVEFQVWIHYMVDNVPYKQSILSERKIVDHTLMNVSVEFPSDIPDSFSVELKVNAGQRSENDWFAWIKPVIVTKKLVSNRRPLPDRYLGPDRFNSR
jgi:hypothetical protein